MSAVREPAVSVVIPTYRRPALLDRCLGALAAQTVGTDRFEVVVVDDASGDATPEVVRRRAGDLPGLVALTQPMNRGPATARNRGVAAASGPLLLFLDDDIAAAPDLVARHVAAHDELGDPGIGVLGRVDWAPDLPVTPFMRWLDRSGLQFAYHTWLGPGPVDPPYAAFYTCNVSLHRAVVEDAGGFDERFPYPAFEDMELAFRLSQTGFRLVHEPDARGYHTRAIDLAAFRRRMEHVARSADLLAAAQPDFPIDHTPVEGGATRGGRRWALRALAPLARVAGAERLLHDHYHAEVAAAYARGRR